MTLSEVEHLVGRSADLAELNGFLSRVRDGGDALLLFGDPGVGKTALLDATASMSVEAGFVVRRIAAGSLEADVDHALLHSLLDSFALDGAAGETAVTAREPVLPAEAIAALISAAGTDAPVLAVIDDLQWADPASLTVLDMLSRRTAARGTVGLLGGARGAVPPGALSWTSREITPLDGTDAEHLAATVLRLPPVMLRRVLAVAGGNPQALLDFGGIPLSEYGPDGLPPPLPPGRLRQAYADQLGTLPPQTRRALLLAALTGVPEVRVLSRLRGLQPALRERIIVSDPDGTAPRFRHPLIRAAVDAVATPRERVDAHRALADLLVDDPLRRAWHVAEASLRPDESVAALLESAARQCLRDGQTGYALNALLRAADQSPTAHGRGRRLTEAAYVAVSLGSDFHVTADLLDRARAAEPDSVRSLVAAAAAAQVLVGRHGDVDTAHRILKDAITATDCRVVSDVPELSDALFELVETCRLAMREDLWVSLDEVLARFDVLPPLVELGAHVHRGPAFTSTADLALLDDLVGSISRETDPARICRIALPALVTDRGPLCHRALQRPGADGRGGEAGRLALTGLFALAFDDFAAGRWDDAIEAAEEMGQRSNVRGDEFVWRVARMIPLNIAAIRGDAKDVGEETGRIALWAKPRGLGALVSWCHHVQGAVALGRGDYEEAFQHASAVTVPGAVPGDPIAFRSALDLVESAMRTGRARDAVTHVNRLRAAGAQRISDRLEFLTAGILAMVAQHDDGFDQFDRALEMPAAARYPFETARIRLVYGERLRRFRLTVRARTQLYAALTTFQQLRARPWFQRAARELEAALVAGHSHNPRGALYLTPQEREVANLAATGLTNREIAGRLLLSPLTVAAHLRNVYSKLAITSRVTIRAALTPTDEAEVAS